MAKQTQDPRDKTQGSFRRILVCGLLSVACGLMFFTHAVCFAQDINFEVTVDKNVVSLNGSIKLNLIFTGAQDIDVLQLPDINGFNWRYMGPSTQISIVNGRVSSSITHMYNLVPLKTGKFKIPSLSVRYRGVTYTSKEIPITVMQGAISKPLSMPQAPSGERIQGIEDRIFLKVKAGKREAYINEAIPVSFKLYINRLSVRDIQYPKFQREGFLVDDFPEPAQYREVSGGVQYNVIEFKTNIYGLREGELNIGPAKLKCNLYIKKQSRRSSFFDDDFFNDFFGRYETRPLALQSVEVPVTIKPLPRENVPASFTGAMGDYQFSLQADPKEVKVGDPITLKMIISGKGNFNTVSAPKLNFGDNFKIYDANSSEQKISKVFEQVIIPKNDKISEIPAISFSFFDTREGQYRTITKGPIPIKVKPLARGEELRIFSAPEDTSGLRKKRETLGRDIIYIKDKPGKLILKGAFLYKNKLFIFLQFIPVILIIFVSILQKKRLRLQSDIGYARRLRAPQKAKKNLAAAHALLDAGKKEEFFDSVFKTLQEYLGDKFHLPSAGITSDVSKDLKERGINDEILDKLDACFNNCDMARYAPLSMMHQQMQDTFSMLKEVLNELEKVKA